VGGERKEGEETGTQRGGQLLRGDKKRSAHQGRIRDFLYSPRARPQLLFRIFVPPADFPHPNRRTQR
jgi:hypothetical protein